MEFTVYNQQTNEFENPKDFLINGDGTLFDRRDPYTEADPNENVYKVVFSFEAGALE